MLKTKVKTKAKFFDIISNEVKSFFIDISNAISDRFYENTVTKEVPSALSADTLIKAIDFSPLAEQLKCAPEDLYSETKDYLHHFMKNNDFQVNAKVVHEKRAVVGDKYYIYVYLPRLKGLYVPKRELPAKYSSWTHELVPFEFGTKDLLKNSDFISTNCSSTKVEQEKENENVGAEVRINYSARTDVAGKTFFKILHDSKPKFESNPSTFFINVRRKLMDRVVIVIVIVLAALITIWK